MYTSRVAGFACLYLVFIDPVVPIAARRIVLSRGVNPFADYNQWRQTIGGVGFDITRTRVRFGQYLPSTIRMCEWLGVLVMRGRF